jgi:signal transduction histidine kinase
VCNEGNAVREQAVGPVWPSGSPPPAFDGIDWVLQDVAELPGVRAQLRRHLDRTVPATGTRGGELHDQLVLAFDEMASNALRHGGGGVTAAVRLTPTAVLIEVSDAAASAPPRPAVGRDPSEGGLGLYLIAELATAHGWYVRGSAKHVWALLPRS